MCSKLYRRYRSDSDLVLNFLPTLDPNRIVGMCSDALGATLSVHRSFKEPSAPFGQRHAVSIEKQESSPNDAVENLKESAKTGNKDEKCRSESANRLAKSSWPSTMVKSSSSKLQALKGKSKRVFELQEIVVDGLPRCGSSGAGSAPMRLQSGIVGISCLSTSTTSFSDGKTAAPQNCLKSAINTTDLAQDALQKKNPAIIRDGAAAGSPEKNQLPPTPRPRSKAVRLIPDSMPSSVANDSSLVHNSDKIGHSMSSVLFRSHEDSTSHRSRRSIHREGLAQTLENILVHGHSTALVKQRQHEVARSCPSDHAFLGVGQEHYATDTQESSLAAVSQVVCSSSSMAPIAVNRQGHRGKQSERAILQSSKKQLSKRLKKNMGKSAADWEQRVHAIKDDFGDRFEEC